MTRSNYIDNYHGDRTVWLWQWLALFQRLFPMTISCSYTISLRHF